MTTYSDARSGGCTTLFDLPGKYTIRRDDARRVIRVDSLGIQHAHEADRYLAELGSVIRDARAQWGRVRVIADLRHSPVRTQDAAEKMRQANLSLYREGDRVALLVESSLLKMQVRRIVIPGIQEVFMSENAAETWLTAMDIDTPKPERPTP